LFIFAPEKVKRGPRTGTYINIGNFYLYHWWVGCQGWTAL